MPKNGEIQSVAIVGTGVIGASWAAEFLAHGFDVVATDLAERRTESAKVHRRSVAGAHREGTRKERVERQTDIYSRSQKGGVACGLCSGERSGTAGFPSRKTAADPGSSCRSILCFCVPGWRRRVASFSWHLKTRHFLDEAQSQRPALVRFQERHPMMKFEGVEPYWFRPPVNDVL